MEPLVKFDWNFEAVPDKELEACQYWEYARESAIIRDVRRRCPEYLDGKEPREPLHTDLQKIQSIGSQANYFLRGFFYPLHESREDGRGRARGALRLLTRSFPEPWQALSIKERSYRAGEYAPAFAGHGHIAPFRFGSFVDAKHVVETMKSQRFLQDQEYARLRRVYPKLSEDMLRSLGEPGYEHIRPSVIYSGGMEKTVVELAWGMFTNEEIIQAFRKWVKRYRPQDFFLPGRKGNNKARDRRVALERLGMMRLLHRFRLSEVLEACPEGWRLYCKREWYKERKRAGEMFRRLFPFLDRSDRPLSWTTQGGRSR